jgi:hypothetical protein
MNSRRLKWQGLCGAANAMLFLVATLSGGCSTMSCEPVGCGSATTLKGSLNFVTAPVIVDMTVCLDHKCQPGSFDLRTLDASTPCLIGGPGAEICLVAGETNRFELHFRGPLFHNSSAQPSTITLELVEHESGAVLLDESRTPTFGHYYVGDCHFECSGTEVIL